MTRNLAMDTNINWYDKPVKTSVWGTELTIPNAIVKTTAAEVGWNLSDSTELSRWQDMAVTTEEARTVTPTNERDRSECYITENATGRKFARKSDKVSEPRPDRVRPVMTVIAPADETGVTVMCGNYLEISGPRIPGVFLELAEEARTIVIVDGQSVNKDMKKAQPRRTGWTRPVFVTEIINSPPILKDGALVATGISTEVIPNTDLRGQSEPVNRSGPVGQLVSSDGRGIMVDRLDLVGPYNSTDQSVFPGLDVNQAEHVPFIRRHPGAMMYHNQRVADGPAGPNRTRRPVGTDGIQVLHDVDRPMAGGPVGPVFSPDPLGPSRMSSQDDLHQPLTVDPWTQTEYMQWTPQTGRRPVDRWTGRSV